MGKLKAYGEISIVDLTDSRKLSAYLTSNQPNVVIYDPNNAVQYSPDWSQSNLVLTPVLFLDNDSLGLTDSGVEISWKRQVGSGAESDLITGEIVKDGVLTVSKNVLKDISSGLLTYLCTITYTDPDTQVPVSTKVQMSYSLVKNATELKDVQITGDQTFKYNGEGTLVSAHTITLTATLSNTSIKEWQYKNSAGNWTKYPNSTTTDTLTVNPDDNVFVNDVAAIKVVTTDSDIFDIHQIVKLHDGATGSDTYTCILSNDVQSVPCASDGTLYDTSLNGCDTKITVYKGGNDDTSNWGITATASAGITGTFDNKVYTYTVTGITVDTGYVEFVCTKDSTATIIKRFTINKDRSGSDGKNAVIYTLSTDVAVMKLNASNVFVPTSGTFSAAMTEGNGTPSVYSGRFKIYETTDGTTYTLKYTSTSNESSKSYSPSSTDVKAIKCELYRAGATTSLLDTQTLSVVIDGKDGKPGDAGIDALNVILGNSAEVIPCKSDGTAKAAKDINIPYSCYKGTKRVAGSATLGTLPTGVTLKSNTDATVSSDGLIVLTVANNASLSSAQSGDITITVTSEKLTSTHKFTWSKSIQAVNGINAILFQIYAPSGDVIVNGKNDVILNTTLMDGSTQVTSGATYQWSKYTNGKYENITSATKSSLTVTADMVDSVAPFRCIATYNTKPYVAYWCVTDKRDPVICTPLSSLGDKIVNGVGIGAAYAMVFQNGEEIDPIKSTLFSQTAPTSASAGDFYYKIDKTKKTVTLMKYNGTTWTQATGDDLPKGRYSWTRRDKDGNPMDETTPYATEKVIYIDKDVVNKKISLGCSFEMD